MDKLLALTVPGSQGPIEVVAPSGIPTGGLEGDGGRILGLAISWLMIAAVLLALGFLLYGGGNWIMSRGEKEKIESARRTIIFAVIGLAFVILSFFFMNIIGELLGVNFLRITL